MKAFRAVKLFRQKNAKYKNKNVSKIMTTAGVKKGTVQCGASRCGNTTGASVIHL